IRDIFMHAKAGFTAQRQRSVLLFDDVESIFMARGSGHAKEWHFSQDSVFFHSVDELDTSRTVIVLTSNRPDLVDEAILDRFLGYEFPAPNVELMVELSLRRAEEQHLDAERREELIARVRRGAEAGR